MLNNADLREYAKNHGVKLWELADGLKCSEMTVTRKFRHELPEAEKEKIRSVIDEIVSERA